MQWSITLNQLWLDYRPGTCVAGTSELDYSKEPVEMDLEVSESVHELSFFLSFFFFFVKSEKYELNYKGA